MRAIGPGLRVRVNGAPLLEGEDPVCLRMGDNGVVIGGEASPVRFAFRLRRARSAAA